MEQNQNKVSIDYYGSYHIYIYIYICYVFCLLLQELYLGYRGVDTRSVLIFSVPNVVIKHCHFAQGNVISKGYKCPKSKYFPGALPLKPP